MSIRKSRYTLLLAALLTLAGCSSSLDEEPTLTLSQGDVFSTQERIDGVIKGIWSYIKNNGSVGNQVYVAVENIGDDMINVSGNVTNEFLESYEMIVGLNSTDNSNTWSTSYQVINNVNTALEQLEANKATAGDKYDAFKQELKFQRALIYFYLNFLYSKPYITNPGALSVPLRLKAENSLEDEDLARSTNTEVYQQILDDTKEYGALPVGGGSLEKITRASQGAVHVLRQRVYMALGDWNNAISEGKAVEQEGYSLTAEPTEPFLSSPTCSESIFSYPQSSTDYGGGHQQSVPYFMGNGKSLVLDRTSGIHSPLYPNYNLPQDKRISGLVKAKLGQYIVGKYNDDVTYQDWVVLFRYAEVELNLAESYYNIGDEEHAREKLAQVRHRSIPADEDPLDVSSLSGDRLRDAIYNERRAEFVGEAIRAIDIKRRSENFVKQKGTSSEFTVTPNSEGYTWPIPETERTNNKLIEDD